jgi:predicted amidophosphoribosyltransferase
MPRLAANQRGFVWAMRLDKSGMSQDTIKEKACRDCGHALEPNARGCPQCALNLEAESMIDRFVWRGLAPGLIVLALLTMALLYYVLR